MKIIDKLLINQFKKYPNEMFSAKNKLNAIVPIASIVFAASFGILITLYIAPNSIGKVIFSASKILILFLPILWVRYIDKKTVQISKPKPQELWWGVISGLLIFIIIVGAYQLFGHNWIDNSLAQEKATTVGITKPYIYFAGVVYWSFGNSLIEEYIWRWFIYLKLEKLMPKVTAIFVCALLFTLHHIIALTAYTPDIRIVIIGSFGVFSGGFIWSLFYLKFRSLWGAYVSHILADLAIAFVGWQILFSNM